MKHTFVLCIVSAILGSLLAIALYDPPDKEPTTVAGETASNGPVGPLPQGDPMTDADLTPEERVNVGVYEKCNRSVVNIMTESVQVDRFFLMQRTAEGEGSGSVIDQNGHILTNFHVVNGARQIQVTLHNGQTFEAKVVGLDPNTDVAVLKIDAPADILHPVTFGSSTGLRVGQRVFAIGNPFGLERTLSTGIVASLNRSLPRQSGYGSIKSIIQIDAAINPGSSGGPLLNTQGQMIGMNTAIATLTGDSAGVGFAIPVNTIVRIVPELIENHHVRRPDLGLAQVYQTDRGLLIAALTPGGPAELAGLKGPEIVERQSREGGVTYRYRTIDRSAADLIVAIDGHPIRSVDDLLTVVESKKIGDKVTVKVLRKGETVEVPVQLVEGQ